MSDVLCRYDCNKGASCPQQPEDVLIEPDDLRGKLPDDVVDQLLAGARTEEEIVGPGGLLSQLTKRLVERAMEVEIADHLGYERHQEPPGGTGNTRNGTTSKRLITEHGEVGIDTPRDRDGSFEPKIVQASVSGAWRGFDDKILAVSSRGLSTRDIEAHLARDLRRARRPRPDLTGHRRGDGRRPRVATTPAG